MVLKPLRRPLLVISWDDGLALSAGQSPSVEGTLGSRGLWRRASGGHIRVHNMLLTLGDERLSFFVLRPMPPVQSRCLLEPFRGRKGYNPH